MCAFWRCVCYVLSFEWRECMRTAVARPIQHKAKYKERRQNINVLIVNTVRLVSAHSRLLPLGGNMKSRVSHAP